ncbi:SprT family zinc-dependent metalloprotease [Vibrio rhizosphaerae]|uniref:Protein SprT n=1 Tax=Vibrio rhizosphaerae TaxID=398736 RepID=A0ABU4IWY1_9VIBR|nr:SprT family zinc-dependent metalloprotease [Vibrio rhizosphaerae]MDW6093915.1 SprT family zinc-dependent metalloprotease [Vibrio rhizosphaerae]
MSLSSVPAELHRQIDARIQSCIEQASHYFHHPFPQPTLSYRLRGKAAGKAYCHRWEIRLNPVLLLENQCEFLQQVIPHEIAHLLVHHLYGRVRPHGSEWQSVMKQVFGLPPLTTHQFDTRSVAGETFTYHCQCQQFSLSVRRHRKVQRQQVIYRCTRCDQPLIYHDDNAQ